MKFALNGALFTKRPGFPFLAAAPLLLGSAFDWLGNNGYNVS